MKEPKTEPMGWGSIIEWKKSEDGTHWYSTEGDILTNKEMEARNERLKGTWMKIYDKDGNDVTQKVLDAQIAQLEE